VLLLYGFYLYINRTIRAYAHGLIVYGSLGILVSLTMIGGLPGVLGGIIAILGGIMCIAWILQKVDEPEDEEEIEIPRNGFLMGLIGGFLIIASIPISALEIGLLEAIYEPPFKSLALMGAVWNLISGLLAIIYCAYGLIKKDFSIKTRKHRCSYCGQMVDVVSNCCRAPVVEHFLISECVECKKDTKMVCSICKRRIS
jgi:hypothetical protein